MKSKKRKMNRLHDIEKQEKESEKANSLKNTRQLFLKKYDRQTYSSIHELFSNRMKDQ